LLCSLPANGEAAKERSCGSARLVIVLVAEDQTPSRAGVCGREQSTGVRRKRKGARAVRDRDAKD
jgi:hypothetical protein